MNNVFLLKIKILPLSIQIYAYSVDFRVLLHLIFPTVKYTNDLTERICNLLLKSK